MIGDAVDEIGHLRALSGGRRKGGKKRLECANADAVNMLAGGLMML